MCMVVAGRLPLQLVRVGRFKVWTGIQVDLP
jgi:hypothetical protein